MKRVGLLVCLAWLLPLSPLSGAEAPDPAQNYPGLNLIPWPKSVQVQPKRMRLTPAARIVVASPELRPLAGILAGELATASGIAPRVISGEGSAGDIVIRVDSTLKADEPLLAIRDRKLVRTTDGAHTLAVSDRAVVTGFDYRAAAEGTATLLQAVARDEQGLYLPAVRIKDWPHADYCAAMLDVARQDHPVESIHAMLELCRVYKVRYLQLHLTDDQGWTFPSTRYPQLGTQNHGAHGGRAPRVYRLDELKAAVAYGDARGVALVPEFEVPGHSGAARRCMPEAFSAVHPQTLKPVDIGVMNLANEALYPALDTLIGEMCDVFRSSPYFHIGTDECDTSAMAAHAGYRAFLAKHGLKDEAEVTRRFIREVNAMVARRGKKTIKWEGIADDACDDVVCMCWVGNNRTAERMVAGGFTVITCPWNLGLPWPEWSMYFCNGSRLARNDPVLGANVVFWEQTPERHLCGARRTLAERQERTWGPDNRFTEDGFARRWNATDSLAAKLVGLNIPKTPAVVTSSLPCEGLCDPVRAFDAPRRAWQDESGESTWFASCRPPKAGDQLTVTFDPPIALYELRAITGYKGGALATGALAAGELQTSADGQSFKTVATFHRGVARQVVADPAVRAVRLLCTAAQDEPLAVADIQLARMTAVSGTVARLDSVGEGNYAVCRGDTAVPNFGHCRVNWVNHGFTLALDTGGGNASTLEGTLTGRGTVALAAGPRGGAFRDSPLTLAGDAPNTLDGTYLVKQGRIVLGKKSGVTALAGVIRIGGQGPNDCLLWTADDQIDDNATVELLDSPHGAAYLDLNGHREKFHRLALAAGARMLLGGGTLRVDRLSVAGRDLPAGIYTGDTAKGDSWLRGSGLLLVGIVPQREVAGQIEPAARASLVSLTAPATLRLVADCADAFQTKEFPLAVESDGKRAVRLSGVILGNGALHITAAPASSPPGEPIELCGTQANSHRGPTQLVHGVLRLAKPAGVTAIPGDLILGGSTPENRGDRVVWAADEQVAALAGATITAGGTQPCWLDLAGHKESVLRLVLSETARVRPGGGSLHVKLAVVNGKPVAPGTYTAAAGWIEGQGTVVVDPRIDVAGTVEPLAPGLAAHLTGDAMFLWGHLAFDVDNHGHTVQFDSGNGNATTIAGVLSGSGPVRFTMGPYYTGFRDAPMILAGDRPNTARGPYVVAKGRVQLQKPDGMDAIAGNVTVGGQGYNDCLRWERNEQINDAATITLVQSPDHGAAYLDLNGCIETAAALRMTAQNKIKTDSAAGKPGLLRVRSLTIGNTPQKPGTYTAANAPWLEGHGKVVVQP